MRSVEPRPPWRHALAGSSSLPVLPHRARPRSGRWRHGELPAACGRTEWLEAEDVLSCLPTSAREGTDSAVLDCIPLHSAVLVSPLVLTRCFNTLRNAVFPPRGWRTCARRTAWRGPTAGEANRALLRRRQEEPPCVGEAGLRQGARSPPRCAGMSRDPPRSAQQAHIL